MQGASCSVFQEYPVYSSPDNFSLDPKTGNLLIGTHPVVHQAGKHLDAPDQHRAPSKVSIKQHKGLKNYNDRFKHVVNLTFCHQT